MVLIFGKLIYVGVLITNAIAVLSEDRFLARIGWSTQQPQVQQSSHLYHNPYDATSAGVRQEDSVKSRAINLIGAVRTLMRFPLIFLNLAIIVWELLFG